MQGPMFKRQKRSSIKGTKIPRFFLSSAVSLSTCHGIVHLWVCVVIPQAQGYLQSAGTLPYRHAFSPRCTQTATSPLGIESLLPRVADQCSIGGSGSQVRDLPSPGHTTPTHPQEHGKSLYNDTSGTWIGIGEKFTPLRHCCDTLGGGQLYRCPVLICPGLLL